MQCPHCFKDDLDERATRCPHCGGEVLPPQATDKKEQSGCGCASCVVAVLANLLGFLFVFAADILDDSEDQIQEPAFLVLLIMPLVILAFVLGVAGLCQTRKQKILPLLGIGLVVWPLVLFLVLLLIAKFLGVPLPNP